jgi:hypothetical protein
VIDHVVLQTAAAGTTPQGDAIPGIALAVLYEYRADRFRVFGPEHTDHLRERLFMADWVSGYNLLRRDYPLLWGQDFETFRVGNQFRPLSARTNDLVRRICLAQRRHPDAVDDTTETWSLGVLARGTLGCDRPGADDDPGREAAAGCWAAAVSFALDDCALVRDLVDFVERYGYLVHGGSGYRIDLLNTGVRSPLPDQMGQAPRQQAPPPGG